LPSSDRLNSGDDAGVKPIALLNIHMIDVEGGIEIDIGNGTSEPTTRATGAPNVFIFSAM
jgi:hypothetical protein